MPSQPFKFIDLFAGAGGLSEGFSRAGFEPVAHVEMDPDACETIRTRQAFFYLKEKGREHHYFDYLRKRIDRPTLLSKLPGHVRDSVIQAAISDETLPDIFARIDKLLKPGEEVDLIIGGPPCQTFSVAGRARKGKEAMEQDPRSRLYVQYADFLSHYKPKMFVFENVLGMLSFRQSRQLDLIRETFAEAGYTMQVQQWNAKDFGVLQSRERLVIIGWRDDLALGYPELKTCGDHSFKVWDALRDLPKLAPNDKSEGPYREDPSPYLKWAGIRSKKEVPVLTWHETRPQTERDLGIYAKAIRIWDEEGRRLRYPEDLDESEVTHTNITGFVDRFKVVGKNERYSQTVVAHIQKDGHYYIHPKQCRSISVREAARLQSFPDNFFFEGPRTSAFRQIGNAVPPLLAERIADSVKDALKGRATYMPANSGPEQKIKKKRDSVRKPKAAPLFETALFLSL